MNPVSQGTTTSPHGLGNTGGLAFQWASPSLYWCHVSKSNPLPTLEELNEMFLCDSERGFLSWRIPGRGRRKGSVGCICQSTGYVRVVLNYKTYMAHRIIWKMAAGRDPVLEIDHINGIKHDNRLVNLREASRLENNRNRPMERRNSTGLKGITKYGRVKKGWVARISDGNKKLHLGCYDTPEAAHEAYWKKAQELYGEFARRE